MTTTDSPLSVAIAGKHVTFGVRPEWATMPVTGLPEGARVVRRRFRHRQAGRAIVRLADGTLTHHALGIGPGGLELLWPLGLNRKEPHE